MTIVVITLAGIAGLYLVTLLVILSKIQKKCKCEHCRTSIHLERVGRPGFVKQFYPYLPLKYYRCRNCYRTFYLHKDTPDTEVAVDQLIPRGK